MMSERCVLPTSEGDEATQNICISVLWGYYRPVAGVIWWPWHRSLRGGTLQLSGNIETGAFTMATGGRRRLGMRGWYDDLETDEDVKLQGNGKDRR